MTTATPSQSPDFMRHPARGAHCTTGAATAQDQGLAGAAGLGGKTVACLAMEHGNGMTASAGVIVEYLDAHIGTWQYSIDEGGHWGTVRTDLINRPGHKGLALERTARLRVLPMGGGSRSGPARMVFHATQRAPDPANGTYQTYPPDERGDGACSITLVLTLADINGAPPAVSVPRPRNKRSLAAQRNLAPEETQ